MRKNIIPKKERRLQAWTLFMQGMDCNSISVKLKVSKATVTNDINLGLIGELQDYRNSLIKQSDEMGSLIKRLKIRMKNKSDC